MRSSIVSCRERGRPKHERGVTTPVKFDHCQHEASLILYEDVVNELEVHFVIVAALSPSGLNDSRIGAARHRLERYPRFFFGLSAPEPLPASTIVVTNIDQSESLVLVTKRCPGSG